MRRSQQCDGWGRTLQFIKSKDYFTVWQPCNETNTYERAVIIVEFFFAAACVKNQVVQCVAMFTRARESNEDCWWWWQHWGCWLGNLRCSNVAGQCCLRWSRVNLIPLPSIIQRLQCYISTCCTVHCIESQCAAIHPKCFPANSMIPQIHFVLQSSVEDTVKSWRYNLTDKVEDIILQ